MIKQYIKQPISAEISDQGGAVAVFVNKETVPLDTSIREAIQGNYAMGQEPLIKNLFMGLMRSMIDGLLRDGHARTLAGLITVYLVVKGEFDLEKGWDDEVNSLQVRARLLNDLDIDITNWAFQDVTPGKRAFTLSTFEAGGPTNTFNPHKAAALNGNNVPNTSVGEEIRIDWAVEGTDKAGTVDAAKVSSTATRIDIAAGAFPSIDSAEYDGKTLVLTVRGNFSNAVKRVVLAYAAAPTVVVDECEGTLNGAKDELNGEIHGENLKLVEGDTIEYRVTEAESGDVFRGPATIVSSTEDTIVFKIERNVKPTWAGGTLELTLTSRGGDPLDPPQVNTTDCEIGE